MFLNSYLKSNNNDKILIDSFYLKIVNVSRKKVFYKNLSVPDTFDGRFDLLVLFSVITIYFLSKFGSKGQYFSQALFDKIFGKINEDSFFYKLVKKIFHRNPLFSMYEKNEIKKYFKKLKK